MHGLLADQPKTIKKYKVELTYTEYCTVKIYINVEYIFKLKNALFLELSGYLWYNSIITN